MIITTGRIYDDPDKDNYRCTIEVPGSGKVRGIATRFENQPLKGDEVVVIMLDDPYQNDCIYLPLKTLASGDFTGIAREGFKLEFKDDGVYITGKADENKEQIILKENTIEIKSGNGSFKLDGITNSLEISGFSTTVKMGGTVAPTGSGPFCGLPNCLFTGAPHAGDTIVGN